MIRSLTLLLFLWNHLHQMPATRLAPVAAARKQDPVVVRKKLAPVALEKVLGNVVINNDHSYLYHPSMWFLPAAQKIVRRKTDTVYRIGYHE